MQENNNLISSTLIKEVASVKLKNIWASPKLILLGPSKINSAGSSNIPEACNRAISAS